MVVRKQLTRLFSNSTRLSSSSASYPSFKFNQLKVVECDQSQRKPKPDLSKTAFGHVFTDHMFECEWTEKDGWAEPTIVPFHSFTMHPAAKVLHYAQELFEGIKAFRGYDSKIRLFRPDMNMKRMASSAARGSLPSFDVDELMQCMKKLVEIDREWVPDSSNHKSLYIRPTMIGIEPTLGVASAKQSLLYILLSPVSGYFSTGIKPVNLLANPQHVRAWPGGCGDKKLGSNYAPTVLVQKEAERQGCQQVL